MGTRFLIDTNILIYYFDAKFSKQILDKIHEIFQTFFRISDISKIEFLGWDRFNEETRNRARKFIEIAKLYPLSEEIVEETIHLKSTKKIKLPDAIIAATCLEKQFTLVTRNRKDFSGIKNLQLYNPFDIKVSH